MTLNRVGGLWDKIRKRVSQGKYHTELSGTGYPVLIMRKHKRKDKGRVAESPPQWVGFISSLGIKHKVGELYPAISWRLTTWGNTFYKVFFAYCFNIFKFTNAHMLTQVQNHAAVRRQFLIKKITQTPSESHQDLFSSDSWLLLSCQFN